VALRDETRASSVAHALRLEYVTIGWNLVEGAVGVVAAVVAGSVALLAFGVDSFVECTSGAVLVWRLLAERRAAEHDRLEAVERLAQRLVAACLIALAVFITVNAIATLWRQEHPQSSVVGHRADGGVAGCDVVAGTSETPCRAPPEQSGHALRRLPDDRLLVAVSHGHGRAGPEPCVRLVVGRPARCPGDHGVPGPRGTRGMER
jgi:hypothetical protein